MTNDRQAGYDTDVAVIGYGPTGLVGALTLAAKGARVTAFERDRDIYARARAVTVNDWTMRIFQELGIDRRIERVIEPQRALRWVTYAGQEVMRVEHPPSTLGTRNTKPRSTTSTSPPWRPNSAAAPRYCPASTSATAPRSPESNRTPTA